MKKRIIFYFFIVFNFNCAQGAGGLNFAINKSLPQGSPHPVHQNYMQGDTLNIIVKYLEDEKRDAKVINMFKNSPGECLGFVYAWIINDIIEEKNDFTQFTREIDKLKNKEQLTPQEAQHFDRILQKTIVMQKFQLGDLKYYKNHKDETFPAALEALEGFSGEGTNPISLQGMLADSGLISRTFFTQNDSTELSSHNIQSTLKKQLDKAFLGGRNILHIAIYGTTSNGTSGGHALGVYQNPQGKILFYDPNDTVIPVNSTQELAERIINSSAEIWPMNITRFSINSISDVGRGTALMEWKGVDDIKKLEINRSMTLYGDADGADILVTHFKNSQGESQYSIEPASSSVEPIPLRIIVPSSPR